MALDANSLRTSLETGLKAVFSTAKDESWEADKVAAELAKTIATAVDTFVRAGTVTGVTSEVRNMSNVVVGSASQNNVAQLQ